jgi:hypothetical protein
MTYLFNLMLALRTFVLESIFESFYCSPSSFVENLKYMGIGMLAIFVVIGAIVGITYLLNTLFKDKSK